MPRKPNPDQAMLRNIKMIYNVTEAEREQIRQMAINNHVSMSGLVRKLLGLNPQY